jgi:hypothetical protein
MRVWVIETMTLALKCYECGWSILQLANDSKGTELDILKGIHEMTFKGHNCKVE